MVNYSLCSPLAPQRVRFAPQNRLLESAECTYVIKNCIIGIISRAPDRKMVTPGFLSGPSGKIRLPGKARCLFVK